jgi:hypothetical protein
VLLAVGLTDNDPDNVLDPVHDPEAVQVVALALVQFSVVDWPLVMVVLVAVKVDVGFVTGGVVSPVTLKRTRDSFVPPSPVQINPNNPESLIVIISVPEIGFVPLQRPVAEQVVAWAVDQKNSCTVPSATS